MFKITAAANGWYSPVSISFAFHFVNSANTLVTAFSSLDFLPFNRVFVAAGVLLNDGSLKVLKSNLMDTKVFVDLSHDCWIDNVLLQMLQSDWLHYSLCLFLVCLFLVLIPCILVAFCFWYYILFSKRILIIPFRFIYKIIRAQNFWGDTIALKKLRTCSLIVLV